MFYGLLSVVGVSSKGYSTRVNTAVNGNFYNARYTLLTLTEQRSSLDNSLLVKSDSRL